MLNVDKTISLIIECDLSGAEDRICKMYSNCTGQALRMVELANRHPEIYDVHRHNASMIFNKPEHVISKYPERHLGKVVAHGSQRQMSGKKLSEKLLDDIGMVVSPRECQAMIDKLLKELWEIPTYYWPWVRDNLMRTRTLTNTWGRKWKIPYGNLNDDVYRRAYSFYLQSECVDVMNQYGFKPLHQHIKDAGLRSRINLQRHDAMIISVPFEEAYHLATFLVTSLERPRTYFGHDLTIPATTKIGFNDKEGYEFKRLPDQDTFYNTIVNEVIVPKYVKS